MNSKLFDTYLPEYNMWRKKFDNIYENGFPTLSIALKGLTPVSTCVLPLWSDIGI